MTGQKKVAVDMDGTLLDFTTPLIRYINELFGTSLKPEDVTNYGFEPSPRIREQIPFSGWFEEVHEDAIRKGLYKEFKVFPYAKEGMRYLRSCGYDLFILTSRDPTLGNLEEDTKIIVQELFPDTFSDIYFAPRSATKVDICKYFGYKTLIEDRLQTLLKAGRQEILPILIDQPYNQTRQSLINKMNGDGPITKEGNIYRLKDLNQENLKKIPFK